MFGKWCSKLPISKGINFWTCWMMITILLNHLILKEDRGLNLLAIRTLYVHGPQELSQIMLLLANIDLDSFWGKNSTILVYNILLSQDIISFTNIVDLMSIGIQGEILWAISSCSWNLIQALFLFLRDF